MPQSPEQTQQQPDDFYISAYHGFVTATNGDLDHAKAGIESSVGSVGDSQDNPLAETIIGLYNVEVIWPPAPR